MKSTVNKTIAFGLLLACVQVLAPEVRAQRFSTPDTTIVKVLGTAEDARFEPAELQINTGDVIRFEVLEGLHTVTAYHPDNRRPLRIPAEAASFDSGPLQAGTTWLLQLEQEGDYEYFCLPHESFGHVGQITVKNKEHSAAVESGPFNVTTGSVLKRN